MRTKLLRFSLALWALAALGCGAVDPDSRAGRLTQNQLSNITGASMLPLDKEIEKAEARYEVTIHKDLRYYTGPEEHTEKHLLDLYIPKGKENWPLLHFVHGGAWFFGHKNQWIPFIGDYKNLGEGFASRGIAVAISNYRLSPGFKHPAHIHDVAAAWAWLCENAEDYGYDPEHMFLMGQSAGGHLVSLLATGYDYEATGEDYSDHISSVISMSGIYSLSGMSHQPGKTNGLVKRAFGRDPEVLKAASPLANISEKTPPFLLLTAERDPIMLRKQAAMFAEGLQEKSVDYRFLIIPRKGHFSSIGDIGRSDDAATAAVVDYIRNFSAKQ